MGLLALLTIVGTVGFMLTEELRVLDPLYMAVITLSTVGYQDVAPATRGVKVSVVAITRDGEPIRLTPEPHEVLRAGDQIVVVGGREEVEELTALATSRA